MIFEALFLPKPLGDSGNSASCDLYFSWSICIIWEGRNMTFSVHSAAETSLCQDTAGNCCNSEVAGLVERWRNGWAQSMSIASLHLHSWAGSKHHKTPWTNVSEPIEIFSQNISPLILQGNRSAYQMGQESTIITFVRGICWLNLSMALSWHLLFFLWRAHLNG